MGERNKRDTTTLGSLTVIDWSSRPALVATATLRGGRLHVDQLGELGVRPPDESECDTTVLGLIGRNQVVMRRVVLPMIPSDEIAGVVQSEAVRQFDMSLDRSTLDHHVMAAASADDSTSEQHVDVAIVAREVIERCRADAQPLGQPIQRLGIRPYATWSALRHVVGEPDEATLLVNMTGDTMELTVGARSEVLFSIVESGTSLPRSAAQAVDDAVTGAIRRAIAVFSNRIPQVAIGRVVLTGTATEHGDLAGRIADELSLPVEILDPLQPVELGAQARAALDSGRVSPGACTAIVGALLSANETWPIDFVNPKRSEIRPPQGNRRLVLAAAMLAAVLVAGFLAMQLYLAWGRRGIHHLTAERSALDAKLKNAEQVLEQFHAVELASTERGNCLLELQRLTEAVADRHRLYATAVAFELHHSAVADRQIVFDGVARDHQAISDFQKRVRGQPIGAVRGASQRGTFQYNFRTRIPVSPMPAVP